MTLSKKFFLLRLIHWLQRSKQIMLVLTRRVGESLVLDNEITVTVLGIKGNQVRLGITAPKDIEVHRQEIYERIQKALSQCSDECE